MIFLDTGYHFVETIGTRDAVKLVHNVNVINVTPEQTVAEQDAAWARICSPVILISAARCGRWHRSARPSSRTPHGPPESGAPTRLRELRRPWSPGMRGGS